MAELKLPPGLPPVRQSKADEYREKLNKNRQKEEELKQAQKNTGGKTGSALVQAQRELDIVREKYRADALGNAGAMPITSDSTVLLSKRSDTVGSVQDEQIRNMLSWKELEYDASSYRKTSDREDINPFYSFLPEGNGISAIFDYISAEKEKRLKQGFIKLEQEDPRSRLGKTLSAAERIRADKPFSQQRAQSKEDFFKAVYLYNPTVFNELQMKMTPEQMWNRISGMDDNGVIKDENIITFLELNSNGKSYDPAVDGKILRKDVSYHILQAAGIDETPGRKVIEDRPVELPKMTVDMLAYLLTGKTRDEVEQEKAYLVNLERELKYTKAYNELSDAERKELDRLAKISSGTDSLGKLPIFNLAANAVDAIKNLFKGEKMTDELIEWRQQQINREWGKKISDAAKSIPIAGNALLSVVGGYEKGIDSFRNIPRGLTGRNPVPQSAMEQGANNALTDSEGLSKILNGLLFGTGYALPSAAGQIVANTVAPGSGVAVGTAMMGSSAFGGSYDSAWRDGKTTGEAQLDGALSGLGSAAAYFVTNKAGEQFSKAFFNELGMEYVDDALDYADDLIPEGNSGKIGGGSNKIPDPMDLKNTKTVQNHMNDIIKKGPYKGELARPYIDTHGTNTLMNEIMQGGTPMKDISLRNGLRWDVSGVFRGSAGTWELVIDLDTNTIVHFNFVN